MLDIEFTLKTFSKIENPPLTNAVVNPSLPSVRQNVLAPGVSFKFCQALSTPSSSKPSRG